MWYLVIMLTALHPTGGVAIESVPMDSRDACIAAGILVTKSGPMSANTRTVCVRKL